MRSYSLLHRCRTCLSCPGCDLIVRADREADIVDLTSDADTPGRAPAAGGAMLRSAAMSADAACAGADVPAPPSPAASPLLHLSPDASPAAHLLARLQRRAPDAGPMQSAPVVAQPQSGSAASAPALRGPTTALEAGPLAGQAGQAVAGAPGPAAGRARRALAGSKRSRPALQPLYASDDEEPERQAPAQPGAAGRSGAPASPSSAGALCCCGILLMPTCPTSPTCLQAHAASGCTPF